MKTQEKKNVRVTIEVFPGQMSDIESIQWREFGQNETFEDFRDRVDHALRKYETLLGLQERDYIIITVPTIENEVIFLSKGNYNEEDYDGYPRLTHSLSEAQRFTIPEANRTVNTINKVRLLSGERPLVAMTHIKNFKTSVK